ncbi:MAG: hypothetical protein ACTSQY_11255 [Candidatus Odinarchaeia archaeon]
MDKRLRLRQNSSVKEGYAHINKKIYDMLEIKEGMDLEVVVSKKKFRFKIKIDDGVEDAVFLSKQEMSSKGLSENTIATVRGVIP